MATGMKLVSDGIKTDLEAKLTRARTIDAYLNTVFFRQWQKAQITRWMTENASEGERWTPVDPNSAYGRRKAAQYSSFPGGGRVTMIASGKLQGAATGRGTGFVKLVSSNRAVFGVSLGDVPYAGYAADSRPFMEFSDETEAKFKAGISRYLMRGDT